jgi:hypothetical protein
VAVPRKNDVTPICESCPLWAAEGAFGACMVHVANPFELQSKAAQNALTIPNRVGRPFRHDIASRVLNHSYAAGPSTSPAIGMHRDVYWWWPETDRTVNTEEAVTAVCTVRVLTTLM